MTFNISTGLNILECTTVFPETIHLRIYLFPKIVIKTTTNTNQIDPA